MKPSKPTGQPAANPEDIAKRRFHATRCAWTTNGRNCLLTGTLSQDTGGVAQADGRVTGPRAFCAFHFDALGGTEATSEGFELWLAAHIEAFPAKTYGHSPWTRYGSDTLWLALTGNENLPARSQAKEPFKPASAEYRKSAFDTVAKLLASKRGATP